MTYDEGGETNAIGNKLPRSQQDWWDKRRATDTVLEEIGGVVTRVGDETVGEMWSLYDGQDVLNEVDPRFSREHPQPHRTRSCKPIPFHVSANTDPEGRPLQSARRTRTRTCCCMSSRRPMRASSCAAPNTRRPPPTPTRPSPSRPSPTGATRSFPTMRVGFICDLGSPGLKFICRTGFAGRAPGEDYPLSNRFDEVDTLVIFDDVLIPWENVLFYRHTKAATLHPRHAAPLFAPSPSCSAT